jgi:general secretion pathway protein I
VSGIDVERQHWGTRLTTADGFTLVEVLVALTIVAVALIACVRAAGVMAQSGTELESRLLAQLSARNQLAMLRATRAFPALGTTAFACPQGKLALRCEQETRTTPNEFFRRVHVRVTLESQPDHRLAELIGVLPRE